MAQHNPARFIVLEGLDGAGTTTQAARLHEVRTASGLQSFLTREPTDGPVGRLIRDVLLGRAQPGIGGSFYAGPEVMCLLFAADRHAHSHVIRERLTRGIDVVSDRYVFSSMAYQSLDDGVSPDRVVEVNRGCAVPDLTIFLDVPVEVCLRRIAGRGEDRSIFETQSLLERIRANYEALQALYQRHFGPLVTIDGAASPDEVHAQVIAAITAGETRN